MVEILAEEYSSDDRRHVVNVGVRHGRDVAIANMQTTAELGITFWASDVIATRGSRLVLSRDRWSGHDQRPDAFHTDVLSIVEINADNQIAARAMLDPDDIDAAFAELDARYLAGEAAAHAETWSVITGGNAALNRRELPPVTPDCVSIDHRRGASFAPGELGAYLDAGWELDQSIRTYIEVVHRLSDLGAVYTHAGHGVSQVGFDAEWRGICVVTVEGNMVNRCEVFDEADIDTAIARFEDLSRPAPGLDNTANRVLERYFAHFAAREWDAMTEALATTL